MKKLLEYKFQIVIGICIILLIALLFNKDTSKPLLRDKEKQIKTLIYNLDSLKKQNLGIQKKYQELVEVAEESIVKVTKAEKKIDSLKSVSKVKIKYITVYSKAVADSILEEKYPNEYTRSKEILIDLQEGEDAKELFAAAESQIQLEKVKSLNFENMVALKEEEVENLTSQNGILSEMNVIKDEQLKLSKKQIRKLKFQRTASIVTGATLVLLLLL